MSDKPKKNYKDTLNLPRTDFSMRAHLLKKEPDIQEKWRRDDLYGQIRQARSGEQRFVLHDGPPYANGNIHMGTALNKILKDVVVRYKTMCAMDAPYVPGWDCHGLPIEQKVMDELGADASGMSAMDIRRRCRKYAEKFTDIQSDQFQRLGVTGQFDRPYITMTPQYESDVLKVFARLVESGVVYRQLKPVHWSVANRTALADAELEYYDRRDASIYVGFELTDPGALNVADVSAAALLIWTTTPWTLPANLAVAVHPDFRYVIVQMDTADGQDTYVIAAERLEPVINALENNRKGWLKSHRVLDGVSGRELIQMNLKYRHPLVADKICPVVPADYVTLEDGTGLVHTAPGHGQEDYSTGLKHHLEIYCPVKEDGAFDETAPDWLVGMSVWDANPKIVEHLAQDGALLMAETVTHSYPHDWRSKTPTIFRATEQWFVAVDRPLKDTDNSLRELAIDYCRRSGENGGVDFIPAWGRNRMLGMLENRPDWCISRQRSWGLPIPAFYNRDDEVLMTPASVRAVARVVAEHGSDAWFTMSTTELLVGYDPNDDPHVENPDAFQPSQLKAGLDIFDVWFESGSSWFAAAMAEKLIDNIPVDMYLEGSDQHRGWFQLSLLPALGSEGRAPFRTILTHGFVVTEDGHKMSKSLGNAIDVIEQLSKRGADILRLWAASQNYQDDVRCSENLIVQAEDAYRKIRNTLRFAMGACFDFNPAGDTPDPPHESLNFWMRMELHRLIRDVHAAYDNYEFHKAVRMMYEFCTVQASSIYMAAVKDRLYCEMPESPPRRSTQRVLHETLMALVKMLAPILPHTCNEAWECIPNRPADEPDNVHLAVMPQHDQDVAAAADDVRPAETDLDGLSEGFSPTVAWTWRELLKLRHAGLVKLEALRNSGVKNPLDTEAVIKVASGRKHVVEIVSRHLGELEDMLGVGHARIETADDLPHNTAVVIEVSDTREKYSRCARSWKRRPDVGSNPDHPDISERDAEVVAKLRG